MDLIDRLFFHLSSAVEREGLAPGDPALTVAALYQRIIPYRAVRTELGILELAEYEHALLRLLSGERGYLLLDVPEARGDIERELRSPNPILGIYRDYADASVRLAAPAANGSRTGAGKLAAPVDLPPLIPAAPSEVEPARKAARLPAPATVAVTEVRSCIRCEAALPDAVDLRFCPGCGADQREIPCGECGNPLRAEWNFCIRCGTARAVAPAPR